MRAAAGWRHSTFFLLFSLPYMFLHDVPSRLFSDFASPDTRNLFSAYRVGRIVIAGAALYPANLGNGAEADLRRGMGRRRITSSSKEDTMLNLALLFLFGAVVAAAFGLTSAALAAAGIAKLLLFLFLLLFVVTFATDLTRSGA